MSRKTIYFDSYCGYVISAVAENGKLTEFNFEKRENGSIIGNVYKGRVESVLPGMQAAFINCGLERNCYFCADDVFPDESKYESAESGTPTFPDLKEGDEVIVQITRAPVGKKGARVTLHPSFVGKSLIYMPATPFVGISRKISDEELRKNLIYTVNKLKRRNEGFIIRTAAPYAKRNQVIVELGYLRDLYTEIIREAETAQVGDLLYTDVDLPMRVLRDTLSYDIEKIIVGSEKLKTLVEKLITVYPQAFRRPVILHDSGRDMLEELGVAEQMLSVISPHVQLDNGAYLVIEKTEALTVIDVNTGKFIGDDSLEQTVYHTNLLAAREIARQVRLRNIGGIVVVDFIDMNSAAHRDALVEELEQALGGDKAKCVVSPMSKFGLVEFTRKRVGVNPASVMTKPCKHCRGGYTKSYEFILFGIRAAILKLAHEGKKYIRLDMNADVYHKFCEWKEMLSDLKTRCPGAQIFAVPHKTYKEEQYCIKCKGDDGFSLSGETVKLI